MSYINHRRSKRHNIPRVLQDTSLPLFEWADQHVQVLTAAGAYLHRRKNVRPAIADLVAELIGIGPDKSR
jgi:hypothetical protein